MIIKLNHITSLVFSLLASWVIFAATPFFQLNGMYPQVDTQVIFLHSICGLMFFYLSGKLFLDKYELKNLDHPLIIIPFSLALTGVLSSFFANNFNVSLAGSQQIGQGVFWYFDMAIMLIIFSQIAHLRQIRIIFCINLLIITSVVSLFTFFPFWQGIPLSFYYFSDYLCFYGVLNFILITTLTKRFYLNLLAFLILGLYFSILENRAAILFWGTTLSLGLIYYSLKYIFSTYKNKRLFNVLFSDGVFVFAIFLISLLILLSSVYFWSSEYNLPNSIKDTLLEAPIVRGKIIENSLYGLGSLKNLFIGNGWGSISSLLLENMNSWQYSQLRLGYNLHFHTHNELIEHTVSLGLLGGFLFLLFIYYIFKNSKNMSFESKLGWFLFFKITCFWFLWTGTLTLFAIVLSCFMISKNKQIKYINFLYNNTTTKNLIFSMIFTAVGLFLFYGAYITYATTKTNSMLNYSKIIEQKKSDSSQNRKCMDFYNDFNTGGIILDRFLHQYSSYLFSLDVEDIEENDFFVLDQLQCKANEIIMAGGANPSLLNTAMQVDTKFYFKFGKIDLGKRYIVENYLKWLYKALLMSKTMPQRGDLIMPILSYTVSNNKNEDALKICNNSVKGMKAMCHLIEANQILAREDISNKDVKDSINLIEQAIDKGIFDALVNPFGFWFNQDDDKLFSNWGLKGIPLSPDILFLISNKEKLELEEVIKRNY